MSYEIVYVWLVLAAVMFVIQFFFFFRLQFLPFALGYLAMAVVAIFKPALPPQIVAFCIITIFAYFYLRPRLLGRFFRKKKLRLTNLDSLVGSPGQVTAEITSERNQGKVSIDREEWMAVSTDGQPIALHAEIIVDKVEGMKVYISPMDLGKIHAHFDYEPESKNEELAESST